MTILDGREGANKFNEIKGSNLSKRLLCYEKHNDFGKILEKQTHYLFSKWI